MYAENLLVLKHLSTQTLDPDVRTDGEFANAAAFLSRVQESAKFCHNPRLVSLMLVNRESAISKMTGRGSSPYLAEK
jgi:hypothetical protein